MIDFENVAVLATLFLLLLRDDRGFLYHKGDCEIINEDEWDAEIYALLLWHFWND